MLDEHEAKSEWGGRCCAVRAAKGALSPLRGWQSPSGISARSRVAACRPDPATRPAPPGRSGVWRNQPDWPNSPQLLGAACGLRLPAVGAASRGGLRAPLRPKPSRSSPSGRMEVGGDMRELALLRSAFVACDANSSGRLEREELSRLCAELRVLRADAEPVFQRLHADHEGAITSPSRSSRAASAGPAAGDGSGARVRRGPGCIRRPGTARRTRATRTRRRRRRRLWPPPGTWRAPAELDSTSSPGATWVRGQVHPQVRVRFGGREVVDVFPVLSGALPCLPLTLRDLRALSCFSPFIDSL
ncbi:uncharacterized protein LOC116663367 [Camelus ferus]|uniref:Uncharacterized protein LOC116663367 n=1 Tax=Camelus ferus TaxID=419612 RepID=A0A8B8SZE6_CAMFR|nr:uncharacterized protein LOC116663367 [Camelus ferus]